MASSTKLNFPSDAHDTVMIVRTLVEALFFFVVFFSPVEISWLQGLPQLNGFKVGLSFALFCSLIFLIIVIILRNRGKKTDSIVYFEALVDMIMIIWLIFIFGGMTGNFFFFLFLGLMEAAFTFNGGVILISMIMGLLSVMGDYIWKIYSGIFDFNAYNLLMLIFKDLTVVLISYYSYSFMRSVIKEKRTSKELHVAYTELKKLDQAKSEFISIASHQLRTPLTALKGYLSMFLEGDYGKLPEKTLRSIENMYQSSERLIRLVNSLLNISKMEAGKVVFSPSQVDLKSLIGNVIAEFIPKAKEKNLKISFECPQGFVPFVLVDEEKIREVISNLVDNAMKYTERGGLVVRLKADRLKVAIEVEDTGIGLSQEEIGKLFQSFSRVGEGRAMCVEGAGLGLYVAKKFVETHDGKIWAESAGKGMGSRFIIELPIKN
ncbi:MAG: HAMP domain-containing sensor histidine kinase [Candidatus Pacebacteria bacterium]|nr:HAMP domain-containing sensor histidine kinase [Candidatus Paceibacterota bacterium]